jgi:hypothetical protein
MFATVEMQLSGEPLAESMGRQLPGYSRDYPHPDIYFTPPGTPFPNSTALCTVDGGAWDPNTSACPVPDTTGFSTAVESYEYSKQPMNNLAFESGAGTSFLFAPLVNPTAATGAAALALLIPRIQHYAEGSNATANFVHPVDGTDPTNRLGWPGFWPTTHPYRSFDPTIKPVSTVAELCSISSDDDPNATGSILNLDYECDYNSLHLPNRTTQIDPTITPGASGWAGWKYSLWVLNYLQSMHDSAQLAIATVPPGQLGMVGSPGNMIVGQTGDTPPADGQPGTYLGSSDIEGFQAQVMIDELDNAAEQWLKGLTTTDGATLGGFATLEDALKYHYMTPLQWFPAAIGVTEAADPSGYPQPAAYQLSDSGSHLFDLLGLAGSYASIYALTDHANTQVGGSQPALAYFDGDPFPADNQVADGEPTLHDRALGMMRVLIVNIDRIHRDKTSGLLIDDATFSGSTFTQGTTIDTTSVAYSIVALRTVRRSLGSQLQLYTNTTPDTAVAGTMTILDNPNLPLTGAPGGPGTLVSDRLSALIVGEAQLLRDKLTLADGHALPGWDVSKSAATSMDDTLDAHTAAIRGLLAAFLATGDTTYRDRAKAVFNRMDQTFYDPAGLVYVAAPGDKTVSYTPKRFAVLEGALRDMYELVGAQPGQAALGKLLQNRITRLIKLVLNGWDDIDDNGFVDYNSECITLGPVPGFGMGVITVGRGGLQMAERSLSGELGSKCDSIDPAVCADAGFGTVRVYTPDREKDCVPEISAAQLPSALANQITFKIGN